MTGRHRQKDSDRETETGRDRQRIIDTETERYRSGGPADQNRVTETGRPRKRDKHREAETKTENCGDKDGDTHTQCKRQ